MGSDAGWGGWTGSNNYVVRYDFSTGSTGASAVSIALENIWSRQGGGGQYWGFKLSTNQTGYANARAQTPDSNSAALQYTSSGYSATLSASGLNLAANTVYYMFVYVVTTGTEYYSGTWNLTSPRITVTEKPARPGKTTFTVSPVSPEYGTEVSIAVTHNSPSYTYKLYYSNNGQYTLFHSDTESGTVIWNTSVLSLTSTTICNLKCSTYEGATFIDDYVVPVTVTFSGVPEVTIQSVEQVSDSTVVNSWQEEGEEPLYVQGYSKCKVRFLVDWMPGGTYASCYINDGVDTVIAQPVSGLSNVYEATTRVFNASGARNIVATAVDSLGRSGSEYHAITVTPYIAPYVVDADAIRFSTVVTQADKSGTNIATKINASGDWSVGGRNVLVIYARFKQIGEGQSYPYKTTVPQTLTSGANYVQINLTSDGGGSVVPIETDRSYTVQFLLCDSLHPMTGVEGTPITVERLVVTSAFVIHSKDGGGGIAFGGYNETDEAEIFYPTHLYDHLIVADVTYGEDPPSGPGEEGQVYFKLMESTGPETGVSTNNYNDLINRPTIDGNLLTTESTSEELGLETVENKITSITATSTNTEYPSALAVYNAIQNADQANVHVAKTSDNFDGLVSIVIAGSKAVFLYDGINRRVYALAKYQSSGSVKTLTFALVDGEYIRTLTRSTEDDFWTPGSTLIADPTNAKSEVFVVNTPVFTDIQQAYTEGKIILVKYDNNMYQFGWRNTSGTVVEFGFVRIRKDNTIDTITVNNSNVWSNNVVDFDNVYESLSNRTIAVTALSTDSQYPTAKAVYDAIRNYSPGGGGGSEDIFIAVPNNTTYQAVTAALNAGKLVFAVSSGAVYPYVGTDNGKYRFASIFRTDCHAFTLSSLNEWDTDDWNMGQGGDPSASKIFFATYGTTTYDEIAAAVTAGKELFAHYASTNSSMIYGFGGLVDLKYRFYTIGVDRVNYITVGTDDVWNVTTKYLVDQTSIAQEFLQSSAYAVGDYVMNNGKLYKCIVAKTASRPWSDTNWQATSIMTEIGNVEAALAALR